MKSLLAPKFPGLDLNDININLDAWVPGGYAARTGRNNQIYFAPNQYDAGSAAGIALIGHELTHVQQYAEFGTLGFWIRYGPPAAKGWLSGKSDEDIRAGIPFEVEGEARERALRQELREEFGENPCEGTELDANASQCIF